MLQTPPVHPLPRQPSRVRLPRNTTTSGRPVSRRLHMDPERRLARYTDRLHFCFVVPFERLLTRPLSAMRWMILLLLMVITQRNLILWLAMVMLRKDPTTLLMCKAAHSYRRYRWLLGETEKTTYSVDIQGRHSWWGIDSASNSFLSMRIPSH